MEIKKNEIQSELYKKILDTMPICCVDIIILHNDKYLLIKRENNPAKNKWWTPGGRILKGETIFQSAQRKCKDETGIEVTPIIIFTPIEMFFKNSEFKTKTHSISIPVLAKPKDTKINLNKDHSESKWESINKKNEIKYIEQMLEKVRENV